MDLDQLVNDILNKQVDPTQLSQDELEAVVEYMHEAAEALLDSEHNEVAQAIIGVIENIGNDYREFDVEIEASVTRGNSYFELEEYILQ